LVAVHLAIARAGFDHRGQYPPPARSAERVRELPEHGETVVAQGPGVGWLDWSIEGSDRLDQQFTQ
jgi:hypothetical protein